eukprot:1580827-Pyramimonas_sp.AAC.1
MTRDVPDGPRVPEPPQKQPKAQGLSGETPAIPLVVAEVVGQRGASADAAEVDALNSAEENVVADHDNAREQLDIKIRR